MRKYLAENEVTLNTKQKTKILETIEQVEQENEAKVSRHFFDMLFSQVQVKIMVLRGLIMKRCVQWFCFLHINQMNC